MRKVSSVQKPPFQNNILPVLFVVFVFVVLVIIFLRKVLFFQGNYILQSVDFIQTYYQKLFYKESLLNHRLPLWNPYIYSGYPFLAHPYNGVFYPLNLIFLIMPVNVAYSWIYALHVFLGGLFMLFLVRHLVKDWWAAFASAATFMFSGFTASRIWAGHFELFTTSIWIPLIFLLFVLALEKKSFLYAIFTGFILAVQFFAGHNQTSFFTLIILGVYFLFKASLATGEKKSHLREFFSNLFLTFCALLFFVIFSAIQLFPTLEFTALSTRAGGIPFFMSAYGSFPPDHLIRFIFPEFFGNFLKTLYCGDPILGEVHWEFNYYIGIVPLVIAIFAIHKGLSGKAKKLLALVVLFVLAVSGFTRIIFLQLWKIRNGQAQGNPFVISIVKFFEGIYSGQISLWKIIPLFAVFFILVLSIFLYLKKRFIDKVKNLNNSNRMILFFSLLSILGIALSFGHYSGGLYYFLYKFCPGYNQFKWPSRHLIITNFSLCVLVGYGMARLNLSQLRRRRIFGLALILILLIDLFWYADKYFYLKNLNEFYPDNKISDYLLKKDDISRVLTLPVLRAGCVYEPSCSEFQPNSVIPLYLYNIFGYDPFILLRYHEFTNILQDLPINDFGSVTIRIKNLNNKNFLKMLNVKYIFMGNDFKNYKLDKKSFDIVLASKRGNLLKSREYLPRFIFVRNAVVAKSDTDIKNLLTSKDFNPEEFIVLEDWQSPVVIKESISPAARQANNIEIINYSPDRIDIKLTVDSAGYLNSSEVYYPGWKAFINGKQTKIYRSNFAFRSIFIPSTGRFLVQFRFEPGSLKLGAVISLLGFSFIIFYFILRFCRGRIKFNK